MDLSEGNDLIEGYLNWLEHNKGRAVATVNKYRQYLERLDKFLGEKDGSRFLNATPELLEEFTGIHAHKQGLAPSSRRPMVAVVAGFYAWLKKKGLLLENPAEDIPRPNAGLLLPSPMELQNAEKLLMQPDIETFAGIRDAAMISILIGCGVRVTGLVNLNQESLTFVRWHKQEWLVLKVREKGKRERLVPAPHECRILIRAYLGHKELESIDRLLPDGDQVLFVSVRNRMVTLDKYHGEARRITARAVNKLIFHYGDQAGIPRSQAHPHAMRHLYGTQLAEDNVNILIAQALMGHADPKSTQVYTHLATKNLTKIVSASNPLGKMRTPVTDLVRELERRGL
jgi:site-specific recombinase XerD